MNLVERFLMGGVYEYFARTAGTNYWCERFADADFACSRFLQAYSDAGLLFDVERWLTG